MSTARRVTTIWLLAILSLALIGGGIDPAAMLFVVGMGIMFLGLPILGVVFILHKVERNFGPLVTYCIAALGLLPTLFVYLIAPMMGIHGGDQGYIFVLILSGLPWAIGWIVTSHKYRKNPGTNP
jgi:hypothetical protein